MWVHAPFHLIYSTFEEFSRIETSKVFVITFSKIYKLCYASSFLLVILPLKVLFILSFFVTFFHAHITYHVKGLP